MSQQITSITGTITLADGSTTDFTVDGYGWRQWGTRPASRGTRPGDFVDTLEAVEKAAAKIGLKDPYSD